MVQRMEHSVARIFPSRGKGPDLKSMCLLGVLSVLRCPDRVDDYGAAQENLAAVLRPSSEQSSNNGVDPPRHPAQEGAVEASESQHAARIQCQFHRLPHSRRPREKCVHGACRAESPNTSSALSYDWLGCCLLVLKHNTDVCPIQSLDMVRIFEMYIRSSNMTAFEYLLVQLLAYL